MSTALYDRIGSGYRGQRVPDPRLAELVRHALGDARSVINVGAGAGAYEPEDRAVIAVEPSAAMRAQRPPGAAMCLDGVAEALPLADGCADAAMAIYTDFHWHDRVRGLRELVRVSRRRVIVLTVDRDVSAHYWLFRDYLPGAESLFADLEQLPAAFPGPVRITPVPIPHDCSDGFVHAFWRRPESLLDPSRRATMAVFGARAAHEVQRAVQRLRTDLETGEWERRNADLAGRESLDLGHRLLVWEHPAAAGGVRPAAGRYGSLV